MTHLPTLRISVSVATQDDAAAVTQILESSYPNLLRGAYAPEILARALPPMLRANPGLLASGTYYLATTSEGLHVGCGGWTREKPGTTQAEPGIGHLRHFAVRAGWDGNGIGRRIYRHCETSARAAGITCFEVFATLNATPFYAALGFAKIDDIVVSLGPGIPFPSVLMRRQYDEP